MILTRPAKSFNGGKPFSASTVAIARRTSTPLAYACSSVAALLSFCYISAALSRSRAATAAAADAAVACAISNLTKPLQHGNNKNETVGARHGGGSVVTLRLILV